MIANIPHSIYEAQENFKLKNYSVTDLVVHYLTEINNKKNLNAVLETFDHEALQAAKIADENFKSGNTRLLEGIPILVKDCILVKGHVASAGSKMLEKFVAPYDATVIRILKENGAIIIGRTNMDEFALGGSGENSAYGKTLNPLDETKVPGGSSSGSAAALAANLCLIALGSDTGGSVRQPASFCGVYGFKPSYGGNSRFGLIAAASSLDTIGVFAKDVNDIKLIYDIIGKQDTFDGTTTPDSLRTKIKSKNNFKKIVAYPKEYIESEGIDSEVKNNFIQSLETLKLKGYEIKPVSLESLKYALSIYYIINTAEVSTNLSRMEGLRFGGGDVGEIKNYQELFSKSRGKFFGPEVKRRIILGSFVLSHGYFDAYYGKAQIIRAKMKEDFANLFKDVSIVLMPTAPATAFVSGEKRDPLTLYLEDIFTVPANLAGVPAISIPSGFDSAGLPFGLQAMAAFGCDENLFTFAEDFKLDII